ncbi:MAG: PorV/PorQ family protein [Bacteroidota bacterium]
MRSSLIFVLFICFFSLSAQCFFDPGTGLFFNLDGTPCFLEGANVTAPFLGFGTSEVSRSINQIRVVAPEQDAIVNTDQNPALLQQPGPFTSVQAAIVPWETGRIGNRAIALKFNVQKQFKGGKSLGFRYENFNVASFVNTNSLNINSFIRGSKLLRIAYAQPIAPNWNLGVAAKYFSSISTENIFFFSTPIIRSGAADIGLKYQKTIEETAQRTLRWQWGISIANIGPRVQSIFDEAASFPLPTSLNTGVLIEQITQLAGDKHLRISARYQVNKLLVPSFCDPCDENANGTNDYLEYGTLDGMLASFSDSPQGLRGELREMNHQFDISGYYQFNSRFGIRQNLLLFYQHPANGNIQYLMAELGLKWAHLQIDFNYLYPNSSSGFQLLKPRVGLKIGYWWI